MTTEVSMSTDLAEQPKTASPNPPETLQNRLQVLPERVTVSQLEPSCTCSSGSPAKKSNTVFARQALLVGRLYQPQHLPD